MHNREFKFGYQHFLLCQKSFLKVSSKWLLKNKSDNGKLLLGKTYSGERFRAILALLFNNQRTIRGGGGKGGLVSDGCLNIASYNIYRLAWEKKQNVNQ